MADSKKSKNSIIAQAEAKADKIVKNKAKTSGKGSKGKKQNPIVKFFKELRSEIKKVVWPSKKKVINNTVVVVVGMCVSALTIWGVDSGLAALFKLIVNIGQQK